MTELYIVVNGQYHQVELTGDEEFNISFNLEDLQSVQSQFANFSKEVAIPATKLNNKLFGFLFNVNSIGNFDFGRQYQCLLTSKQMPIFTGVLELDNIDFDKNQVVFYNIILLSNLVGLKDSIKDKSLADVDIPLPDNIDEEVIRETIDGTYDPDTPVDWFFVNLTKNSTTNTFFAPFEKLEPCIKVKAIWDYIFNANGFNYESEFLTSPLFKKLRIATPNSESDKIRLLVYRSSFSLPHVISNDGKYSGSQGFFPSGTFDSIRNTVVYYTDGNGGTFGLWRFNCIMNPHRSYNFVNSNNIKGHNDINTAVVDLRKNDYVEYTTIKRAFNKPSNSIDLKEVISFPTIREQGTYLINVNFDLGVAPSNNNNFVGHRDIEVRVVHISKNSKNYYQSMTGGFSGLPRLNPSDNHRQVLTRDTIRANNSTNSNNYTIELETEKALLEDDIVFVEIAYPGNETVRNLNDGTEITVNTGSEWKIFKKYSYANTLIDNVGSLLSSEFSQKDFVDNIINMFNLQFAPLDEQTFRIEPYPDFFGNPTIKNWEDKVDYRTEKNISFPGTEQPSKIVFKYKHDEGDFFHQRYKDSNANNLSFGSRTINNEEIKNNEKREIEIDFASQPLYTLEKNNPNASQLKFVANGILPLTEQVDFPISTYSGDLSDVVANSNERFKVGEFTPRIFLSSGVITPNGFQKFLYQFPTQNPLQGFFNVHCHLDDIVNPNFDLNFFTTDDYVRPRQFDMPPENNLFNLYHAPKVNRNFNVNNKKITAKFFLTDLDIAKISYNDIIFVFNNYFRLLNIKDYNLASNFDSLTEVELLQVNSDSIDSFSSDEDDGGGGPVLDKPPNIDPPVIDDPPIIVNPGDDGIPDDLPTANNVKIDCGKTEVEPFEAAENLNLIVTQCSCDDGSPLVIKIPCNVIKSATNVSINIKAQECPEISVELLGDCEFQNGGQEATITGDTNIFSVLGTIYI